MFFISLEIGIMTLLMIEIISMFLCGIYVGVEVNRYYWLCCARKAVDEKLRLAELELRHGRRAGVYNIRGENNGRSF